MLSIKIVKVKLIKICDDILNCILFKITCYVQFFYFPLLNNEVGK